MMPSSVCRGVVEGGGGKEVQKGSRGGRVLEGGRCMLQGGGGGGGGGEGTPEGREEGKA